MSEGRGPAGLPAETTVDHLVYATPDLREGMARIRESLGVEPEPGGRHPRWGTRNALLGLGSGTYLEIIGPDPEAPAPPSPPPFDLGRRSEPGLGGWAARIPTIEDGARAARRVGFDLGEVMEGSREASVGNLLRWRLTDPCVRREEGTLPFLIDWGHSPHPSESLDHPLRLHRLRIRHPEPGPLRAFLGSLVPRVVVEVGRDPELSATVDTPDGRVELT